MSSCLLYTRVKIRQCLHKANESRFTFWTAARACVTSAAIAFFFGPNSFFLSKPQQSLYRFLVLCFWLTQCDLHNSWDTDLGEAMGSHYATTACMPSCLHLLKQGAAPSQANARLCYLGHLMWCSMRWFHVFITSRRFYASIVCLHELGLNFKIIFTTRASISKGVINPDSQNALLPHTKALNEL